MEHPEAEDWEEAEEYLKECEADYISIGRSGLLCLTMTINPLRSRFDKGERTKELYDEIMNISL